MNVTRLQHVEVLNRLGQALSRCAADRASLQDLVNRLREILGIPSITLWLLGARRRMLEREVCNLPGEESPGAAWLAFDEGLAFWQKDNIRPLVISSPEHVPPELRRHALPCRDIISLPILYREASLQGVLNFYDGGDSPLFDAGWDEESRVELFRGVAGQVSVFAENRALEANSLLSREIHHRVKNNLQVVASLLGMQMRRLDRIAPAQALQDSINRIYTIAAVHERLSNSDFSRVDLADLVRQMAESMTSSEPAGVTVRVRTSGDPLMLDSREATSAALVANELLLNAIQHGTARGSGSEVEISVLTTDNRVRIEVQDNGPGLPPDFLPERDNNLGLTIVSTLVRKVLRGEFGMEGGAGTRAWVSFLVDAPEAVAKGRDP